MTVMDDDFGSGAGTGQSESATKTAGGAGDQNSLSMQGLIAHQVGL